MQIRDQTLSMFFLLQDPNKLAAKSGDSPVIWPWSRHLIQKDSKSETLHQVDLDLRIVRDVFSRYKHFHPLWAWRRSPPASHQDAQSPLEARPPASQLWCPPEYCGGEFRWRPVQPLLLGMPVRSCSSGCLNLHCGQRRGFCWRQSCAEGLTWRLAGRCGHCWNLPLSVERRKKIDWDSVVQLLNWKNDKSVLIYIHITTSEWQKISNKMPYYYCPLSLIKSTNCFIEFQINSSKNVIFNQFISKTPTLKIPVIYIFCYHEEEHKLRSKSHTRFDETDYFVITKKKTH